MPTSLTNDQRLTKLREEYNDAEKRGNAKEMVDCRIIINHMSGNRPIHETQDYIRTVNAARNRQAQRRHREARGYAAGPTMGRPRTRIGVGDHFRTPDGKVLLCTSVESLGAGPMVVSHIPPGMRVNCPVGMATRVDDPLRSTEAVCSTAPCATCPLVVAVADAFYHTVADVLEAGLTPASADALQGALDAYEAAITALGR